MKVELSQNLIIDSKLKGLDRGFDMRNAWYLITVETHRGDVGCNPGWGEYEKWLLLPVDYVDMLISTNRVDLLARHAVRSNGRKRTTIKSPIAFSGDTPESSETIIWEDSPVWTVAQEGFKEPEVWNECIFFGGISEKRAPLGYFTTLAEAEEFLKTTII